MTRHHLSAHVSGFSYEKGDTVTISMGGVKYVMEVISVRRNKPLDKSKPRAISPIKEKENGRKS